jgi:hypothetical protein
MALITGATAGIGRSFAHALASDHDLVLVARDEARLEQVAGELAATSAAGVRTLSADLTTHEGVDKVTALLSDPVTGLRLLVNNAGHGLGRPFAENDIDIEEALLDLLVRAPMHLSHAALDVYLADGHPGGAVINVSSVAGFLLRGTYAAHKAWVTSFTRWADLEYRHRGARFLALCPGFVRTEFHARMQVDPTSIPGWMWLDADELVAQALLDLAAGRSLSVPSRRYQVAVAAARYVPPGLVHRFAALGR